MASVLTSSLTMDQYWFKFGIPGNKALEDEMCHGATAIRRARYLRSSRSNVHVVASIHAVAVRDVIGTRACAHVPIHQSPGVDSEVNLRGMS